MSKVRRRSIGWTGWIVGSLTGVLAVTAVLAAQARSRPLGPDTKSAIQEASVDPAFNTTKIERVALVPFSNAAQYPEAATILAKNLVAQFGQSHPELKIISPTELMDFVVASKLEDEFNVFLGDYVVTNSTGQSFLNVLRTKQNVDAVLMAKILGYGQTKSAGLLARTEFVVGLEMGLYRTTDGRRIWWGKDSIAARTSADLQQAALVISEVFARFFGRLAYR